MSAECTHKNKIRAMVARRSFFLLLFPRFSFLFSSALFFPTTQQNNYGRCETIFHKHVDRVRTAAT